MKTKFADWVMLGASVLVLAGCAGHGGDAEYVDVATPTVDYIEALDVYSAPHKDSFLNQLAMNYRSYAIYNARTSGYPDMGEMFAQKAVAAFSGELPFPESLGTWAIENEQDSFELAAAYNDLMEQLKNDAADMQPELAAEAQAKFDCWVSALSSGQMATAQQCKARFYKAIDKLRECKNGVSVSKTVKTKNTTVETSLQKTSGYYPETRQLSALSGAGQAREGVIIVNNVNVPEHLINPVPVQPLVFNQNIYGGATVNECPENEPDCVDAPLPEPVTEPVVEPEIPMLQDEFVSREEFINMMMAMRSELAAINARLDQIQAAAGEKTMIKVQQIPLEPKQHVMEEVFEVRFDFNKATIKPEYQELIEKLASATQENKNIKVSVVGHTDTAGSSNYNYALGGRRAEAVQKMLIKYGIPAAQIVAVSAGEEDLAVPTPDNTPNAENRRVRVVKEVHYTEQNHPAAMEIEVHGVEMEQCGEYGC